LSKWRRQSIGRAKESSRKSEETEYREKVWAFSRKHSNEERRKEWGRRVRSKGKYLV